MKIPVRYLPLINGTAFMGMGTNTGPNEGKEYPYVLWEEYEALEKELAAERQRREADADYWLESFRRVDQKLDEVLAECATLPEDVQDVAKLELWAKEFRRNHPSKDSR